MYEGVNAFGELLVVSAGEQQPAVGLGIHLATKVVAQRAGGTARSFFEQLHQDGLAIDPCRFQFGQPDVGVGRPLGTPESQRGLGDAGDGVFEQALVDVAYLFHVQSTIGEQTSPTPVLQHLQRFQEQKDGTVVDG